MGEACTNAASVATLGCAARDRRAPPAPCVRPRKVAPHTKPWVAPRAPRAEYRPRSASRARGGWCVPKIFYVTDLHGSEICWRKFLNAGAFYRADVVILGGDVTGKAMVPIVQRANGTWEASLQDHRDTLKSEDAIVEFEKRVMNRGYYPIRVSDEEYVALQEDEDLVDKRFKEVMVDGTARWIDMAEEKLGGTGIRVVACPANDDMFEIDDLLAHARTVETG